MGNSASEIRESIGQMEQELAELEIAARQDDGEITERDEEFAIILRIRENLVELRQRLDRLDSNRSALQEESDGGDQPAASVESIPDQISVLSDLQRARLDAWIQANAQAEETTARIFTDEVGGERLAQALRGNSDLGVLSADEMAYLANEAARAWVLGADAGEDGGIENARDAAEAVQNDAALRAVLAEAYIPGDDRVIATMDGEGDDAASWRATKEMGILSLKLDPAAMLNHPNLDPRAVCLILYGDEHRGEFSDADRMRLLQAVGDGRIGHDRVDNVISAAFVTAESGDVSSFQEMNAMANALARSLAAHQPEGQELDQETIRARLYTTMAWPGGGGRDLLFDEDIMPDLRNWALTQAAINPEWDSAALAQGWESEVVGRTFAKGLLKALEGRGTQAHRLKGEALRNTVGQALGLQPDQLPAAGEGAESAAARQNAGLDNQYYRENESLDAVVNTILRHSGSDGEASVTVIPVAVTGDDFGAAQFNVFRTDTPNGPVFVDNAGSQYPNFEEWRTDNQLPPGKMTYPRELVLGQPLVTEDTPENSWTAWLGRVGDGVALGVGIVSGVALIVGTGGTATPLVAAAGAGVYAGARATNRLHDQHERGHDVTDLSNDQVRADWIDLAASSLSVGAMGAAAGAVRLAGSGTRMASVAARGAAGLQFAANSADVIGMGNTAITLRQNWDQMTEGQRTQALLSMAFQGGMMAASTRAGGALIQDAFSFGRLRNQIEFGSPYRVDTDPSGFPDLPEGGMRVAYDTHPDTDAPTNIRIQSNGTPDPDMLALHSQTGRQIESAAGLWARLRRVLGDGGDPPAGSPAWEARLEIDKIGRESDLLARQLELGGADLTPTERARIETRLDELAAATEREVARLEGFEGQGHGAIASPDSGSQQAASMRWKPAPDGYTWVRGERQPHLRRLDKRIPEMSYNPATRTFEYPSRPRVDIDDTVGDVTTIARRRVRIGDPPRLLVDEDGNATALDIAGNEVTIRRPQTYDSRVELPDGSVEYTKNGQSVRYDPDGFPIFESIADIHLGVDALNSGSDSGHFNAANRALRDVLADNPRLVQELGLTQDQVDFLNNTPNAGAGPPDLSWHHHQETGLLQLVRTEQHAIFPHLGGMPLWGGGRPRRRTRE